MATAGEVYRVELVVWTNARPALRPRPRQARRAQRHYRKSLTPSAAKRSSSGHGQRSGFAIAIYLGAWRGRADAVTIAALAALCVEAALVLSSGGNCPLGPVLRRLGDETPFFELFLPPRAAKLAVPVLAGVSVLGAVLLAARVLWRPVLVTSC
jgi:hypothetical protein